MYEVKKNFDSYNLMAEYSDIASCLNVSQYIVTCRGVRAKKMVGSSSDNWIY
jgi:hypothetical protein